MSMLSMRTSALRFLPLPSLPHGAQVSQQHGILDEGSTGGANHMSEKWKTDVYAEHTHQYLTRMLSMRTSALRVCSACAPVSVTYAQLTHKPRSIRVRK
jgi:hypothetical protein